jgi:hypothetical protein
VSLLPQEDSSRKTANTCADYCDVEWSCLIVRRAVHAVRMGLSEVHGVVEG